MKIDPEALASRPVCLNHIQLLLDSPNATHKFCFSHSYKQKSYKFEAFITLNTLHRLQLNTVYPPFENAFKWLFMAFLVLILATMLGVDEINDEGG